MTFILRAQNKSQGIKPQSSSIRIKIRHVLVVGILFCSFALTAGLLIFNEFKNTPTGEQKTVITKPHKTSEPDISKKSTKSNKLSTIDRNKLFLSNLTQKVTSHIYTQNPTGRSVFIEGIAYHIGDHYESIEIRDITEQGITVRITEPGSGSTDLTLSLVENWSEK